MSDHENSVRPPLAIVGLGAIYPGSASPSGLWHDILAGTDLMQDVPPHYWLVEDFYDPDPRAPDKCYAKRGAFLSQVPFDPIAFGIPPTNLSATDSCQLLALMVAEQVLADATQGQFATMDARRVSVILGVAAGLELVGEMSGRLQRPAWVKCLREHGLSEADVQAICARLSNESVPWTEATFPGLLGNVVAGRIANRFNLGGTNCTTDAACASSFSALAMAVSELYLGDSDLVLTGGVDTTNDPFLFTCFSKTPALSPTNDCRPFSVDADGTMLGEGVGMVALKRLADAERDGDRIYAVLRGVGTSSDGRSKSVYAPRPEGQAAALARAYAHAGFGPETVELIEAHGTGTRAGDLAEFEGLSLAFNATGRPDRMWCALGSIKSQLGHTKAAAGVAGLIKATLALQHRVLPPTIKVREPDPKLLIDESPFYLNTETRPWIHGAAHPRRAGVSSFGFGGTNYHVVLEEYSGPSRKERQRTAGCECVLFAESSLDALLEAIGRARAAADAGDPELLLWLAYRAATEFDVHQPYRLGVAATSTAELAKKLKLAHDTLCARREQVGAAAAWVGAFELPGSIAYGEGAPAGQVAWMFPGQGSQYLGMGGDLALTFDVARAVWDRAQGELLDGERGVGDVVFPRPVFTDEARAACRDRLTATEWAQPALGVASLATAALLDALGVACDLLGGHSFGELTALCRGRAFGPDELLSIARQRGELMARAASEPGAMLAVFHAVARLRELDLEARLGVVLANINAPEQAVLSGPADAVAQAERELAEAGVRTTRLPVSTAFHSPLVAPASGPLLAFLEQVQVDGALACPVFANALAAPYGRDADAIRLTVADQIQRPVRFAEQVQAMWDAGARVFIEVGPGSVLTGLCKQCLEGRPHLCVSTDHKGRDGLSALMDAAVRLAAAGVLTRPAGLFDGYGPPRDPRTKKEPKLTVAIDGVNHGKRYPPPGGAAALPRPNLEVPPLAELLRAAAATTAASSATDVAPATGQPATVGEQDAAAELQLLPALFLAEDPAALSPAPRGNGAGVMEPPAEVERSAVTWLAEDGHAFFPDDSDDSHELDDGEEQQMADGNGRNTGAHEAWFQAFEEIQRQTAEAHSAFHRAMAEAHVAFLRTAEQASLQLCGALGGAPASHPTERATELRLEMPGHAGTLTLPVNALPGHNGNGHRHVAPSLPYGLAPLGAGVAQNAQPMPAAPAMVTATPALAPPPSRISGPVTPAAVPRAQPGPEIITPKHASPAHPATAATDAAPTQSGALDWENVDFAALLLAVVAEKTGYPVDILAMEMSLEADLGIDSIKRVEILSTLQERLPGLPEIDASQLPSLQTLGQVVEFLRRVDPRQAAKAPAAAATDGAAHSAGQARREGVPARAAAIGRFALNVIPISDNGNERSLGLDQLEALCITDDGRGVAPALAAALRDRGVRAAVCTGVETVRADGVIFLGALAEVATVQAGMRINRDAFAWAKAVAERLAAQGGVFVTVQQTDGMFGVTGTDGPRAWLCGLPGLCKTAALEWPQARVRAIDVERADALPPAALAERLADELMRPSSALEVGLTAAGARVTLALTPRELEGQADPVLVDGDVVLVSGGARGVTAHAMIALAASRQLTFVLLGRTPLAEEPAQLAAAADEAALMKVLLAQAKASGRDVIPVELGHDVAAILAAREVRATLSAIEAQGSTARYLATDIRDGERVARDLGPIRAELGPIRALVHGAGVLADRPIRDKTLEQFDRVFNTKVGGLEALLAACKDDPLRVICLFSSVAARFGNLGQSDYAMANEVLNRVAAAEAGRRGSTTLVRALGFGPWDGGMVTPTLRRYFVERGVPLLSLHEGAARVVCELSAATGEPAEVVIGPAPAPSV